MIISTHLEADPPQIKVTDGLQGLNEGLTGRILAGSLKRFSDHPRREIALKTGEAKTR